MKYIKVKRNRIRLEEWLPSKHETLSSNLVPQKKKKREIKSGKISISVWVNILPDAPHMLLILKKYGKLYFLISINAHIFIFF
jgi:hypothetical protein